MTSRDRVDRIEREMIVPNPPDQVWEAITEPRSLSQWFGDVAEVDLRPGGEARFGWTEYGSVFNAVVEVVDPPHTFAYRWSAVPNGPLEAATSTLVTFSLSEVREGTRVRVVETGFASLPEDLYDRSLEENTKGWESEFDDLRRHLLQEAAGARP